MKFEGTQIYMYLWLGPTPGIQVAGKKGNMIYTLHTLTVKLKAIIQT